MANEDEGKKLVLETIREATESKGISLGENQTETLAEAMLKMGSYHRAPIIVPAGACAADYLPKMQIFGQDYRPETQAELIEKWKDSLNARTEKAAAIMYPHAVDPNVHDTRKLAKIDHPGEILAVIESRKLLLIKSLTISICRKDNLYLEILWVPSEDAKTHQVLLHERDNSLTQVGPSGLKLYGTVIPL